MAENKQPATAAKAPSKKTEAIEILYAIVRAKTPEGKPLVATNDDVVAAIDRRNGNNTGKEAKKLSNKNPANFLKDLIRKTTCNRNWPEGLKTLRITARQMYGKERVLEFIPYRKDDSEPFPDRYDPIPGIPIRPIETLSLSRAARDLGRLDEPWLTQVLVYQRVAHHHFAVSSPLKLTELSHLQMSVKTQPEIDAVFLATLDHQGIDLYALVTCEAKQHGERILEDQVREQVAQAMTATVALKPPRQVGAVIPLVVKAVTLESDPSRKRRGIYLAEFAMIRREDFEASYRTNLHSMPLDIAARSIFELQPPVRGISMSESSWATALPSEVDEEEDV